MVNIENEVREIMASAEQWRTAGGRVEHHQKLAELRYKVEIALVTAFRSGVEDGRREVLAERDADEAASQAKD